MKTFLLERLAEGHQLVENSSGHPDVGWVGVGLPQADFWSQVIWSSELSLREIFITLEGFCNTEITYFQLVLSIGVRVRNSYQSVLHEEDVLRLQVSMKHMVLMQILYCEEKLGDPVQHQTFIKTEIANACLSDSLGKVTYSLHCLNPKKRKKDRHHSIPKLLRS